jgi:hypothetical protein
MKIIISKRFTLGLATASVLALVPAGPSLADPPSILNDIGRHQHYLVTPDGDWVPIGPDFCDNPDLQDAFNQFHYNIHHNSGAPTKGPQGGAPGLHDGEGADMAASLCD